MAEDQLQVGHGRGAFVLAMKGYEQGNYRKGKILVKLGTGRRLKVKESRKLVNTNFSITFKTHKLSLHSFVIKKSNY
jgi:hypothetical protein